MMVDQIHNILMQGRARSSKTLDETIKKNLDLIMFYLQT